MSKISILSLKKEGEQERLRREIHSLAWNSKNLCEEIKWQDPKEANKKIEQIRKNLAFIEDLFAELT